MSETYGAVLEELHDIVSDQVALWRRLLETTRESTRAIGASDPAAFEHALKEQIETLRSLRLLERERDRVVRCVGEGTADARTRELTAALAALAAEVRSAGRVARFAIDRGGNLVEARLGLHRQAGTIPDAARPGVNRIA
jgi:hypothetical protein